MNAKIFNWQSKAWSLGPSITLPLFEGGRNRANLKSAQAAYDEGVAKYHQQVLVAFKEEQVGPEVQIPIV